MKARCMIAALAVLVLIGGFSAQAYDRIYKLDGSTTSGNVVGMSAQEVRIDQKPQIISVPVNEIKMITYDGEPRELTNARLAVLESRFQDAIDEIDKIEQPDQMEAVMLQDRQFYRAYALAQLAIGGSGSLGEAYTAMKAFSDTNTGNYHYYTAMEANGDLLVAARQYADAEKAYMVVATSPWPDYKMRSALSIGQAKLQQNQIDEAMRMFQVVMSSNVEGAEADQLKLSARLGRAVCGAKQGQPAIAVTEINRIIGLASAEDIALQARAYNALGNAHLAAGRDKDALLAFLHVDVLYPGSPDAHAEALYNLQVLWNQFKQKERAARANNTLRVNYANSPWTAKATN